MRLDLPKEEDIANDPTNLLNLKQGCGRSTSQMTSFKILYPKLMKVSMVMSRTTRSEMARSILYKIAKYAIN